MFVVQYQRWYCPAENRYPEGMTVLKVKDGPYWDYWLTDDGILRVKVLSDWSRYAFMVSGDLAAILSFLYFLAASPLFILFLTATLVELIVLYAVTRSRRRALLLLSPENLVRQGRISRRVTWTQVSSVELKGARVTIRWDTRKIRLRLAMGFVPSVHEFLRLRVPQRLTLRA